MEQKKATPKIYVKLKFENTLRMLGCKANRRYEDILYYAMKVFPIPKQYSGALYLADVNGYVFHPDVFENYVLLFPKPHITFIICVDEKKIQVSRNTNVDSPYGRKRKHNHRSRDSGKRTFVGIPQNVNWNALKGPS